MGNRGRFGKYGEVKRLERLRRVGDPKSLSNAEKDAYRPYRSHQIPIRIQMGGEQDASFIRELSQILFSEYGEYDNFLPSFLRHKEAHVWIATYGKKKIGFIIAAPYEGELDTSEIVAVALEPKYQGKGIGKRLLEFALKNLKESNTQAVIAHVAEGNNASLRLFLAKGFLPVSVKKAFYRSQDAIMLVKKIKVKGENHEENHR